MKWTGMQSTGNRFSACVELERIYNLVWIWRRLFRTKMSPAIGK